MSDDSSSQDDSSLQQDDQTAALQEQIAKLTDIAARAQADLQNFKKRQERDTEELQKFAIAPLIMALLPVRNDLARAAEHDEGSAQVLTKFDAILESVGVQKIEAEGQTVDTSLHEVISTGPGEKDVITEVHEEGYELHGRVLRPAKVICGDGSEK
jgi:molecular chaperone GrpE